MEVSVLSISPQNQLIVMSKNSGKKKNVAIHSLRDLFVSELKSVYWTEKKVEYIIPAAIANSSTEELAEALLEHQEVVKGHIKRLEDIFKYLDIKNEIASHVEIDTLTSGVEKIIVETKDNLIRDQGLILAMQKIAHYKIASYGTLSAFAGVLDEADANYLIVEILNEEKAANENLTDIAMLITLEAYEEEIAVVAQYNN